MSPMPPRPGQPGVMPPGLAPAINEVLPDRWRSVAPRTAPVQGAGNPAPGAPGQPVVPGQAPAVEQRPGAPMPQSGGAPQSGIVPMGPDGKPLGNGIVQTAPNEIVIPRRLSGPDAQNAN
jgi:hypothetical protein